MQKHAYLILAHNEFELLKKLIETLDYEYNDIYIHIDKNAKDFNAKKIIENIKKSNIYFIKRRKLEWGGYSIVNAELALIEKAAEKSYSYYHLLSGVDYPLMSQQKIHEFFEKNAGKEFIKINQYSYNPEIFHYRIKYYHFFQEKLGRGNKKNIYHFLNRISLKIQTILNVDRRKKQNWVYKKGSQWFSITEEFVGYILEKKKLIKKQFKYTSCGDEIFLQTVLWNSKFRDRKANIIIRYEVWEKWASGPKILEKEDDIKLQESNAVFARKFSFFNDKSRQLVEKICDNVIE